MTLADRITVLFTGEHDLVPLVLAGGDSLTSSLNSLLTILKQIFRITCMF